MRQSTVRESFSSTGSNSIESIIKWLIQQIHLTPRQAKLVFYGNGGSNKSDLINLFIQNDNGMVTHLFCPINGVCEVCEGGMQMHSYIYPEKYQAISQKLRQQSNHQIMNDDVLQELEPGIVCLICDEQLAQTYIVSIQGKAHNICVQCFGSYLKEQITNARVLDMKCPHCDLKLETGIIAQYVDALSYKKYKIFLNDKQMLKNPDLRWCPNPKCGKVINVKKGKHTKCYCGTQICIKCNREAHPKLSCKQIFKKQTQQWGDAIDVQNCSKCHSLVQKVSGCNHMTCQVCRYQWCWLCKSTYSSIHFSPLNPFGCPGLQNGDHLSQNWGCFRRYMYRFALLLLIIILIPIALPVAMIIAGPTLFITYIKDRDCYWPLSNWQKFPIILSAIILGLILNPIAWIGLLVYFVPLGISALIQYYRRIRQMQQSSKNRLHQKLIQQGNFEDAVGS